MILENNDLKNRNIDIKIKHALYEKNENGKTLLSQYKQRDLRSYDIIPSSPHDLYLDLGWLHYLADKIVANREFGNIVRYLNDFKIVKKLSTRRFGSRESTMELVKNDRSKNIHKYEDQVGQFISELMHITKYDFEMDTVPASHSLIKEILQQQDGKLAKSKSLRKQVADIINYDAKRVLESCFKKGDFHDAYQLLKVYKYRSGDEDRILYMPKEEYYDAIVKLARALGKSWAYRNYVVCEGESFKRFSTWLTNLGINISSRSNQDLKERIIKAYREGAFDNASKHMPSNRKLNWR